MEPSTPNRRAVVRAHPLREALLGLIDRDGTTTSTIAARELGESTGSCSFHLRRLEALGVIEKLGPRRAFLVHMTHDLGHAAASARLPAGVELAYDGLVLDVDVDVE